MCVNTDNTMGQHGQHHTSLWGNADNTILILVYVNAGNTILLYGAMRATPHLCMGQHMGNTINFVMCGNTGNTVLLYGCQHYTHCMKQYWQHYGYIHNSNMHRRHHAFMWQHM